MPIPETNQLLGTTPSGWHNDPVTKEAESIGLRLNFPPEKIRGVKLTDDQYAQYVRLSGRLAHARLEEMISSPYFQQEPASERLAEMKGVRNEARGEAREQLGLDQIGRTPETVQ